MDEKDLTKEVLIEVAKDLSKIFEQPIETADNKTDMDLLKKDLIEAGNELQEGDNLTDESKDVLIFLGVKLPWKIEAKTEPTKPVEPKKIVKKAKAEPANKKKAADKKEKEKPVSETKTVGKKVEKAKPPEKEDRKTQKYTRVQAFCDALYGNPKTIKEIAQKAKDLYDKANPGKEESKLSYIQWTIEKYYIVPFVLLGFVELKDKKYSLKD